MPKFFIRAILGALAVGLALAVLPNIAAIAQDEVIEALGVPGPIEFAGDSYALAWTSHPEETYYKQEYLPEGQAFDSYTSMFMVDAQIGALSVQDAANAQVAGLEKRKASDPVVNYQIISKPQTGEIILDFVLSDFSGPRPVVEWNAYRYAKLGHGTALYAISRRAYGDDIEEFLNKLGQMRQDIIGALAQFEVPPITPVK